MSLESLLSHHDEIWEGEMIGVRVGGIDVLLTLHDGELFAYEDRCPHQGAKLSEGHLNDGVLTCPRHHFTFDIRSGAGINPSNLCLKRLDLKEIAR